MNEIDLKTKIEGLKKAIAEHKDFTGTYESQLKETEQELKDYNKVELTPMQLDDIYEAVEAGVEKYDFSDTGNYNIEYGIEYDNKVYCENLELQHSGDLVEAIVEKVCRLFKEADAPEDDQVNTHTVAEKII
tara:strand:+ start:116 stop:511 length:396 start_codon:yes stop_codon:yes gene_type:complete